ANSDQKSQAKPEPTVSRLQSATLPARRNFLLQTSARRPSGRPTTAYSRMNAVPSQPSSLSDSPQSLRTFSCTAGRIWRSKKFMVLTPSRTASVKTRRGVEVRIGRGSPGAAGLYLPRMTFHTPLPPELGADQAEQPVEQGGADGPATHVDAGTA